MNHWYMVTVVGRDQPGIVAAISRALADKGWRLDESSMARLGGNFTIMMMVQGDGGTGDLCQLLQPAADAMDLHVHVDPVATERREHIEPNVEVRVYGADRAGIVADVTGAMAAAGLNILDLNSEIGGSNDAPVYIMVIDGYVEGGADRLEAAISELGEKGLKVGVEPLDTMLG